VAVELNNMRPLPHTRGCFVCGEANSLGLNLRLETDGRIVQTRFTPQHEHAGFKGTLHGGLIATVLDEVMVWACGVQTKRFAYCAELSVRFLRPAQPGRELLVLGELLRNRKDKLFETKGELRDAGGLLLATALGKYIPVKEAAAKALAEDFVGGSIDAA
jgi:acyl-coenzyme A thioesterase PaaI-like protein